jgi:valyl-tRNA synthetase
LALEKVYSPSAVEEKWYAAWEAAHLFHATPDPSKKPFTIVIPPPNVTGVLHMGHILNNTLQDMLIRYKRMSGYEACWIPGTDHAGIATQNVVERALRKEGKTRHDLGREEFVRRVWEWRKQYGGVIIRQLRKLGASCDWDRERFTMDETLSAAVREVFVRLYDEGLIYRGKYIVNWCPKDHTAISDDEVNHSEQKGKLYYLRYPLKGGTGEFLTVATTRPETMLGDTAVAVNPADERYRHLIGRTAVLPLVGREIPIVGDDWVSPEFGTGLVKVTPAHDPNDFEIGLRHRLPQINIFDISARTNENVPDRYRRLDRYDARRVVLEDLERQGLLVKVEDHTNNVGHCYRCDTVIEPYLSDQWFVRMKPLAEPALRVVLDGTIRFYPDRWTKVYQHWMTNIRDWCISRQLWWGHRIPVWYCGDGATPSCAEPIVRRETPASCPHCGGTNLRQDEDVLDTWFSSWLWPFSVHDWPQQEERRTAADLKYFYPTDTLVTAPEIIFFWVARMIMSGLKLGPTFTGSTRTEDNVPFREVYFTGIVRDDKGRKMSKSLGNSPEPLDLIQEYGADAVRFTTMYLAPLGQDIFYSPQKNELGRNFANKIWNAGRFLLMNLEQLGSGPEVPSGSAEFEQGHCDLADRWILSRYHSTALEIESALRSYEVNKLTRTIYDFFWHDFADWYLEMLKSRLYGAESQEVKQAVLRRAVDVYDASLRLLHPLMPFVTEELWQNIRRRTPGESIMRARFATILPELVDQEVERSMSFVQRVIETIRGIRGEMGIPPSTEIPLLLKLGQRVQEEEFRRYEGYVARLARVSAIRTIGRDERPRLSASSVVDGEELFIPLEGIIDIERERTRLRKELDRVQSMVTGLTAKLSNPDFLERAPVEVVGKEREKLATFSETLGKLRKNYDALES